MYEAKQIILDILSTLHLPYPVFQIWCFSFHVSLEFTCSLCPPHHCLRTITISLPDTAKAFQLPSTNYNYLLIKLLFTMNDFFFQNTNLKMSFRDLKSFSGFLLFLRMKILTMVNEALFSI